MSLDPNKGGSRAWMDIARGKQDPMVKPARSELHIGPRKQFERFGYRIHGPIRRHAARWRRFPVRSRTLASSDPARHFVPTDLALAWPFSWTQTNS